MRAILVALARSKTGTVVAVLTLAIAIGMTAAMFSTVYARLARPLPFPEAEKIFFVGQLPVGASPRGQDVEGLSPANYRDFLEAQDLFAEIGGFTGLSTTWQTSEGPRAVFALAFSPGLFRVFGIPAAQGRFFDEEDQRRGDQVAVLSHSFWTQELGGDPDVLGEQLRLDEVTHTIVGVMPREFELFHSDVGVWLPLRIEAGASRQRGEVLTIGKLRDDVTVSEARARLPAIAATLSALDPQTNEDLGLFLWTLRQGTLTLPPVLLWGLQACVGLVLLIACANLSAIFLTTWSARQAEIAMRTVLGATRARVIAYLTAEVATVVAVGSVLGLLLSALLIRLATLGGFDAGEVASTRTRFEPMVVLFTVGLAVIVTLATGLWPAIRSSGGNLSEVLSSGSRRAPRNSRLRRAIVAGQFAVSFGVLATTAMLVHLFWIVRNVSGGFESAGVATFRVLLPEERYQQASARRQFVQSAVERLAALPGVEAAAVADRLPRDPLPPLSVPVHDEAISPDEGSPEAVLVGVTEDFLAALGIPLVEGAGLEPVPADIDRQIAEAMQTRDPSRAPLSVLVSRSLAEELWPGDSAVGKTLFVQSVPAQILGIVGDVVHTFSTLPEHQNPRAVYAPLLARPPNRLLFVLTTSSDLGSTMRSARSLIRELDSELAVRNLASLEDRISTPLARYRIYGYAVAGFGLVALCLAGLGLYSAMALSVVERTKELGIRRALGASHEQLMTNVGLVGIRLLLWGSFVGIPLALVGRWGIDELAAGVAEARLTPLLPAFLFLGAVALLGCLPAALAATRLQPTEALRED